MRPTFCTELHFKSLLTIFLYNDIFTVLTYSFYAFYFLKSHAIAPKTLVFSTTNEITLKLETLLAIARLKNTKACKMSLDSFFFLKKAFFFCSVNWLTV